MSAGGSHKVALLVYRVANVNYDYFMDNTLIESVEMEKDLGVIIHKSLSITKQCVKAAKTANQVLGMLNCTIRYKIKDNMIHLYKLLVRPHLEYCMQAWRPYLQKDVNILEVVQRRFTRMIPELHGLEYAEGIQ